VFIDVDGTRDRSLEVEATQGYVIVPMGGTLAGVGPIRLTLHVNGVAGSTAVVIADGNRVSSRPISSASGTFEFIVPGATGKRWLAVTIERAGHPLLIGNPIYLK
jgi:hypothetical protein